MVTEYATRVLGASFTSKPFYSLAARTATPVVVLFRQPCCRMVE